jgi:hydroxymethylglutaryl-CoA synthase
MLVSDSAEVLEIEPGVAGYWTQEIADTFRPTARAEMGDNETSLFSYLDALEGAYQEFREQARLEAGKIEYSDYFARHIYHAPFPGMTFQAHRTLLGWDGPVDKATASADFQAKVGPGLSIARRIGSAYGASNFVCLLGMLAADPGVQAGDRISMFAYGSGCQGEFYEGRLGAAAVERVAGLGLEEHLDGRAPISTAEYERREKERAALIDCANYALEPEDDPLYAEQYQGRRLLTLRGLRNYYREYEWS